MYKLPDFRIQILCILLICSLPVQVTAIQSENEDTGQTRPRIGLVLSGGGAKGVAHIGVLKLLEQNRIPVDVIAGTSFGAIIGGLYATGYSAGDLETILANIDWEESLSGRAPREYSSFRRKQDDNDFLIKFKIGIKDGKLKLPSGLITPNNLRLTLQDLISEAVDANDFDDLKIPFRAVATDLESGRAVVLDHGNLASAIVASMAVPALFPPVEYDGRLLVDGGVSNNVPVDVARDMGADIVIVVDISTPAMKKAEIESITKVVDQLILIMTNRNTAEQLASLTERDILIRPELDDIGFADFERALELVPRGLLAAQGELDRLQKYSLSRKDWKSFTDTHASKSREQPVIDFIRIVNDANVHDEVIRAHLSQQPGEVLDVQRLSADLSAIYGFEIFDEVSYELVEGNDRTGIKVLARRSENGQKFLRFGLALQEDFNGETGFQMSSAISNLAVNRMGGEVEARITIGDEFGLFAEFYQPVDYAQRYYVFANGGAGKYNRNIFDDSGRILSQARISQVYFQGGVGANFGNWGTLRFGLQRVSGTVKGRIGYPEDFKVPVESTALVTQFSVDTLDNVQFPRKGMVFDSEYSNSMSWQKGDSSVDTIQFGAYHPFSWGKNTLGVNYQIGTSMNGTPDETDMFALGGFLNLSAYFPGQLTGNHRASAGLIYYRRIKGGLRFLTKTPIYLGAVLEAGNVWNNKDDVSIHDLHHSASLFLGVDTFLGPVYLGYAVGDNDQSAAFLYIGQIF